VDLLDELLDNALPLRGADGSTVARIGSVRGVSAVVVAAAARQAGMLSVAGYRLLARAAAVADHLRLPLVTLVDTAGADPLPPSEDAGIAAAIADTMTALLGCASPTIAVVHGAGGSGGALAAATADVVAVTPTGWFAALDPVGAAAALRSTAEQAADAMRVAAVELVEDGFADAIAPADPGALAEWLAWRLATLAGADESQRLDARQRRWRSALDVSVSG
jgi:acetyl-CoA carboxylase carboxyl transferase subunit beta